MAQHFLLSSMARSFSIIKIARMTEKQADTMFRKVRCSDTNGKSVCPNCVSLNYYDLSTRKVYKCKHCYKQFSVTSGTLFSAHKLPLRTYLLAIEFFTMKLKE